MATLTEAVPGYEGLAEIARHDDGVVFLSWQPTFSRSVAVHVLSRASATEVEADARRAAPLAGHPNVVTVHELGVTAGGDPYLVTELLDRGAVADWARREAGRAGQRRSPW